MSLKILDQLKGKVAALDLQIVESNYILFSKSGFTESLIEEAKKVTNIVLVDFSGSELNII